MLPKGTFSGRVSVVTGGSSGIGEAIATELARLGSDVAIVGRKQDQLDAAATRLREHGTQITTHSVDVRDRESVEATVADLLARWGQIDHLVNSAAGNFQAKPEDLSPNAWSAVVRIVLDGTWNFTQVVGQHMIERGAGGSILSIGTTAAMIGGPSTVHSTSAKAGVIALTKSLGVAWAEHNIRVNVMTPGPTEGTGAMTFLFGGEGQWDEQVQAIPLKRMLTRQEAADASVYLLSDYASYITGHNLVIDGGRSLGRAGGVFGG
ncbi:SDR family oxidoreductase [Ornithinimicrobium faecis]|uniref:SDR family oxidoreductase n=1 Tax=Ornithinimicrobium faecis TaxID=2934158 RepID=A0ABY4YX75_9MICO|nr:SDR family oxidoreductase [Ornithinimicrobium sp. HY1793]USQ81384.1 SDR family oxidoreductase [Ornithinimicrobium sp. HY1793]